MALMDSLSSLNWRSPWVIGAVVIGGAVVAFIVVPKLRAASQAQSAAESGPTESSAQQSNTPGGLVILQEEEYEPDNDATGAANPPPKPPEGGPGGGPGNCPPGSHWNSITKRCEREGPPPKPPIKAPPTGGGGIKPPVRHPTDPVKPKPAEPPKQFVHPQAWPKKESTLSGIAQSHGVTLARLEAFPENQYIKNRPGGWNRIYTTDAVRIA